MAIIRNNQRHGFHLVDPSPWPLIAAFSALMLTFGGVLYICMVMWVVYSYGDMDLLCVY